MNDIYSFNVALKLCKRSIAQLILDNLNHCYNGQQCREPDSNVAIGTTSWITQLSVTEAILGIVLEKNKSNYPLNGRQEIFFYKSGQVCCITSCIVIVLDTTVVLIISAESIFPLYFLKICKCKT